MKKIRAAIRCLSIVLLCAFIGVAGFLSYTVYTQGSRWLTTQYNARLTNARKNVGMGEITDRNGVLLASTNADGTRVYHESKAVRRALSQTVGDQMSMSGTGVETFHAGTLLGLSGSIIDRTWQYLTGAAYQGDNIRLTVDAELATEISRAFPEGKEGAAVVVNYLTGEVLAMVSKPDYDPEALVNRQSGADESGSGYLNRCLQGQYAPGSVFKIVTLTAALKNMPDTVNRAFECEGTRAFGDGRVTCYGGEVHGRLTLPGAFSESCNVTFAQLATEMGAANLAATAREMGFNHNFQFRDVVLYESTMPEDIQDASELAWTGVGQGRLLVTPMHMALIASAVANGGIMPSPQLISQVTGMGGIPRLHAASPAFGRVMPSSVARIVGKYMRQTVAEGTGTKAAVKGYTVCGKTGTAEVSNDKSVPTNAWFVGYIEEQSAPYAVAVVVEGGGTGGSAAAPLAAKIFRKALSLSSAG